MTRKQIEAREAQIYDSVYHGEVRFGKFDQFTEKQKQELAELSCRKMINSILVYNGENAVKNEEGYNYKQYLKPREEEVGKERLKELISEQIASFKDAKCEWIDGSENFNGGPYKSCKWKDEL